MHKLCTNILWPDILFHSQDLTDMVQLTLSIYCTRPFLFFQFDLILYLFEEDYRQPMAQAALVSFIGYFLF